MAAPRGALQTGTTLDGRFRVGLRIGGGVVTTLFSATDPNGESVAIEVLDTALIVGPSTRERFVESGFLANSIGHPQVARVLLDGATPAGDPFVVLDLRDGESLEPHRLRAGGTLPVDEVVDLLAQLFEVLETAHLKGVAHGALGTSSLFVERGGRLRVLDFGFTGLSLDGRPTPRGDLRAAGTTAFYLLTGSAINLTENETVAAVLPLVPPAVAQIIDFAIYGPDQDASMSAGALRQALERLQPRLAREARPVGPDDQTKEVRVVDQLLASELLLGEDDATGRGVAVAPTYSISEASLSPVAPRASYPPPAGGHASRPPPPLTGMGSYPPPPPTTTRYASRPPPSLGGASAPPPAFGSMPPPEGARGPYRSVAPLAPRGLSATAIVVIAVAVLAAIVAAFMALRVG